MPQTIDNGAKTMESQIPNIAIVFLDILHFNKSITTIFYQSIYGAPNHCCISLFIGLYGFIPVWKNSPFAVFETSSVFSEQHIHDVIGADYGFADIRLRILIYSPTYY